MTVIKLWPSRHSEHEQFEVLIQPHLKQLYKLAYRFSGQRDDAEDLVQDVLLKLFPRLKEMQSVEKLGPWLARVLYRHFIDKLRSKQRSPLHLVGEDEGKIIESYSETTPGPAGVENAAMLQNQLQHSLNQLNEDQRMLVILHDVEGYTLQEIHSMHDVSIGTLKSRLNRARTKLRELLKNVEPFNADSRVN
jgi:RNA polymerase sigma factor (sigma-70 family)